MYGGVRGWMKDVVRRVVGIRIGLLGWVVRRLVLSLRVCIFHCHFIEPIYLIHPF